MFLKIIPFLLIKISKSNKQSIFVKKIINRYTFKLTNNNQRHEPKHDIFNTIT